MAHSVCSRVGKRLSPRLFRPARASPLKESSHVRLQIQINLDREGSIFSEQSR